MSDIDPKTTVRFLPSVDELLRSDEAAEVLGDTRTPRSLGIARDAIERVRERLLGDTADPLPEDRVAGSRMAVEELRAEVARRARGRLRRVINATGVILHTNLGRAPLSSAALDAIAQAGGYCTLEYDLAEGTRGRRAGGAEAMLCELTGAGGAVIVNNGAAAAFLVLSTFCEGREVIVSRGELVEIGGDFRIPDVLTRAGARLREVGTTNRTKIADYRTAISADTAMILKVHPSNYRITGFAKSASREELRSLADSAELLFYEDAGSGALVPLGEYGLADEPVISDVIAAGADLASFSGDKLMGGVQAGIVVGRADLIEAMKRHPLYRVLRPDKLIIAAIEATLDAYLEGRAAEMIPALRMLATTAEEVRQRAEVVSDAARRNVRLEIEVVEGESVAGGGSAPGMTIPGFQIALRSPEIAPEKIEERLRAFEPPIIARVAKERVLLDMRTVQPTDDAAVINALMSL